MIRRLAKFYLQKDGDELYKQYSQLKNKYRSLQVEYGDLQHECRKLKEKRKELTTILETFEQLRKVLLDGKAE